MLCSLSARNSDRCRAIIRSWIEILKLAGSKAMAWAALPTVFANRFLKDHENIFAKIVNAMDLRNDKDALIAQLEAILKYPVPDQIPSGLEIPTLLITGAQDPLIETDDVRKLARTCRARHEHLEGVGHSIPAEAPEIFQKLVLEFLESNA